MRLYQIYCVVLLGFLSFSLENIVIASESKENELSVKGVVYDTEQNPVSYANVYVKGTVKGALTDAKGKFQLFDLEKGVYEVQISAVGYKTKSQVVEVDANGVLDLGLVVLEIGVEMPEFSIIGIQN